MMIHLFLSMLVECNDPLFYAMFIIYCDTLTYYNVYRYLWYDDALIVYDIVFPPMTHSNLSMLISSYDTLTPYNSNLFY